MAKKQLTPEEHTELMERKKFKREQFSQAFFTFLAVFLAFAITFSAVFMAYSYVNNSGNKNVAVNNPSVQVQQDSSNSESYGDSSIMTEDSDIVTENVDNTVSNEQTASDSDQKNETTNKTESSAFASTEEMVAYFNKCANKVKTEATKVVKNYEKRSVESITVPSALQSTAETMMSKYMADDTEPIVYATKQEIRDNFIVPNQDYVSCLKASDVVKADCKDNGKEYVIYFKLKDEKNPRAGSGVGSVCDVIETHEIADKAGSLLKEFSAEYYNCEITATINKDTGRMTHAIYKTPLKMLMVVNMFGTHNVGAGITFTKDYTITY